MESRETASGRARKTNVFSNHYKCNDPALLVQREKKQKKHEQGTRYTLCVYSPSAITNNERTSNASLSSFFIKFHHGCPILIVFICWEMFVNVISFNFGGTFLLRRVGSRPSSVLGVRGGEIQNIYYALCVCSALSHSYLKSIHSTIESC